MAKRIKDIDIKIGEKLRLVRLSAKITLSQLSEKLGVTTQQINKYENASNRISSSTLYLISQILDIPIEVFFQDIHLNQNDKEKEKKDHKLSLELVDKFSQLHNYQNKVRMIKILDMLIEK